MIICRYISGFESVEESVGLALRDAAVRGQAAAGARGHGLLSENATQAHDQLAVEILDSGYWNETAEQCRSLVAAHCR